MNDLDKIHFDYLNGGINTSIYKSKEAQDKAKREIIFKRYEDIYLASPYILAQIMYEEKNPILNEYITRRTGITIDGEIPSNRSSRSNLIMDLEDHFVDHFISLFDSTVFLAFSLQNDKCYLKLKEMISKQDTNVGENIYDVSMRTLLNIIYQYVRSQDKNTRVYSMINSLEVLHQNGQRGLDKSYLKNSIIDEKLRVLDKFLELANYRNCEKGIILDDDFPDVSVFSKYHKKTLVGSGVLKDDLDSYISHQDIEDFYFKYHREMKWNVTSFCQSNDIFNDKVSCGDEFYLSEKNTFYLDGRFYQMCPKCGCITDVTSNITMDEVKNRIINRKAVDENLSKRSALLSELYSLDSDYKSLVKKRGN